MDDGEGVLLSTTTFVLSHLTLLPSLTLSLLWTEQEGGADYAGDPLMSAPPADMVPVPAHSPEYLHSEEEIEEAMVGLAEVTAAVSEQTTRASFSQRETGRALARLDSLKGE